MFRQTFRTTFRHTFRPFRARFRSTAPPKKGSLKELASKYGWVATGTYVALCAIDLPIFYAIVHFAGPEKILDAELKIRGWVGASTEKEDTYLSKAMNSDKGRFMAEFGVAYILHKLFLVVRVPITVAITPKIASTLGQWGFNVTKGLPSVDKAKLASKVEQRTGYTPNVLKSSAENASSKVASKAGEAASKTSEAANKAANADPKKSLENMGRPPTKRNKWFSWFM